MGFGSEGPPGSLCMTSPLSLEGSLLSSHKSKMVGVGMQDLEVNNEVNNFKVSARQNRQPVHYPILLILS